MRYEWDPTKADANLAKHRIRFADAVAVFGDEQALTIDDPHPDEERFITLGMDGFGRVLVVVYTWRGDLIRLISARKATRAERAQYAEGEP
jgi:uncharacterized protein